MFEIEKCYEAAEITAYPSLQDTGKVLFFDIETTGLSAFGSSLYLIGVTYCRDGIWHLHQWFSASLSDEIPVLQAFSAFLEDFDTLVHYNGDTFDIPYLKSLYEQYHLNAPFERISSVDLLKAARRIRPLLNPASLRQKDIETALGIRREDLYSGAELIAVYAEWQADPDDRLLHDLLLHNEDDVKGLVPILEILALDDLFQGSLKPKAIQCESLNDELLLTATYSLSFPFTGSIASHTGIFASFSGNSVSLRIPLYHGELKHFLPNPKAYYYLPREDMIIPRELGSGVDPNHRVPAKKDTCYVRLTDDFIPALPGLSNESFRMTFLDKESMIR
ncbi:MAG: ribonuclease H-like domain-containing protein, partial [Lachnospiraceae bacterium]|nr:ribonuclease H-like domain-containing protein [Lachnospiraceae bacterium]